MNSSDQGIFTSVSTNNRMGLVRYFLCSCVIINHITALTGIEYPLNTTLIIRVGGFFALSGFLLFPSFQRRPTWKGYMNRRARRLLPQYVLVVLLCALLFVFISSLNWKEYYSNIGFWEYLAANLSFMNFVHPNLPGVFEGEAFTTNTVNSSLWTMKGEWICYLSVPLLVKFIANSRRRATAVLLSLIAVSMALGVTFYILEETTGRSLFGIVGKQFGGLLVYFYCGALINVYYAQFLKFKWPLLAAALIMIATAGINPWFYPYCQPIVMSVFIIWISMVGQWGTWLRNHDCVSYDMYLFHFPIIQLAIYFGLPTVMSPWLLLATVWLTSFAVALMSWHFVGKRILYYKKKQSV